MASIEELRADRIKKIEQLKAFGMEVYPAESNRTLSVKSFLSDFDNLTDSDEWLSGRVMSLRVFGAIAFADIFDGTGRIQAFFKSENIDDELYALFNNTVDVGDFIEVRGKAFITEREEQSILVSDWRMLSKSLRPLPEKWHGLQDPEEKLRKRYLDLLLNPDAQKLFERKNRFWEVTRDFLKTEGFLEVETPTLEVTTGGAEAEPFKTHHNDFDLDVYLRISIGELWQKRLMAAGFPKVFEIGRAYRNEGTSPEHLQEFTNMEFYWGYANYRDGMELVKKLYITLAQEVYGKTKFTYRGHTFDLSDEWKEIDYVSEVESQLHINILEASEDELKAKLEEHNVDYEGATRERMIDSLWKVCRKTISGPAFLINHPKLVAPLAKTLPGNEELVERFQPLIAGSEVGNGYSELNNPIDQKERFVEQQKLREAGDEEAMMPDWEFVEMLEHGMPPTCGFGFGERLFTIFEDKPLRETQLFPLVKPKLEE